ncbi:MAG: NYN domain-containing protein [Gammaproteobacteria bacterium]|nr:NYN domain-containing protein [Gammaproteobacteria bacterium]
MNNKKKVAVYVDGFNLYHGLVNLQKPHLKWLNLRSLAEKFIDHKSETIEKVYYFSAIATFMDKETTLRHRTYIEALETNGVEFIGGNFKDKWLDYKNKHIQIKWKKHEEKETDVNISIHMVRDAIKKRFDKFILITNDTDIVPAIKMAKSENSSLQFKLLTPPTLKTHDSLLSAIKPGSSTKLTEGHIQNSLLAEKIQKPNGKIIHIPKQYIL